MVSNYNNNKCKQKHRFPHVCYSWIRQNIDMDKYVKYSYLSSLFVAMEVLKLRIASLHLRSGLCVALAFCEILRKLSTMSSEISSLVLCDSVEATLCIRVCICCWVFEDLWWYKTGPHLLSVLAAHNPAV